MSLYMEEQTATIASSGTTSGEIDLQNTCDEIRVTYPAMTACTVSITVSRTTGGTFVPLANSIAGAVGAAASADRYAVGGYRYIKLVSSVAQGGARTIYVQGIKL
jgi:hypothetical protein